MNWVINGKYVLVRTSQTELAKAGFLSDCIFIKRIDLKKFSKYIPKDALETINFVARVNKEGQLDKSKPIYFIEY